MARPKRVPGYLLHKRTGNARVVINGYEHHLGEYGTAESRERYNRLISEYLVTPSVPPDGAPVSELTIVELIAAYIDDRERYFQHSKSVRSILEAMPQLNDLYGRTRAAEFGPRRLVSVRRAMIDRGLSRKLVNARVGKIRRMFKWGTSQELLPAHIYQQLASVEGLRRGYCNARETEPVRPVDDAVVEATLPYLSRVTADMVRVQRLCGMRPSEVCRMKPCDINRDGELWEYRPPEHKGTHRDKERVVLIGPRCQQILLRYLLRDAETPCFSPREAVAEYRAERHQRRVTPFSCGHRPGSRRKTRPKRAPRQMYDKDTYRQAINRACDRAGVERWSPHRLRHARATEVRRHFGLEGAQVALGHAHATVTEVYARRDARLAEVIAREIG